MQNKSQTQRDNQISKGVTFFCYECNNVGRVFVECWTDRSDRPFKIELLQHEDLIAFKVDEIRINNKQKGKIIRFPFCGQCGQLLEKPMDSDYKEAMDNFNPNFSNN